MDYEPKRYIPREEREKFAFKTEPEGLEVTPELLADLHDVAFKFGIEDEEEGTRTLFLKTPIEILVRVSADPSKKGMTIGQKIGTMDEGLFSGVFKSGQLLWWDKRVEVHEAITFIDLIDRYFGSLGWISTTSCERERKEELRFKPGGPRRSVEASFGTQPMIILPVAPNKTPEEVLAEFDEPDRLAVISTAGGGKAICLASARESILVFQAKRRGKLAELGYESLDDLPSDFGSMLKLLKKLEEDDIQ